MHESGIRGTDVARERRVSCARSPIILWRIQDDRVADACEIEAIIELPRTGQPLGTEGHFVRAAIANGCIVNERCFDMIVYVLLWAVSDHMQ